MTISPSINGKSKFFGNSLSLAGLPASHTFQTDQLVTVCFTVPGSTDGHKGFKAEFSDSTSSLPALATGTTLASSCSTISSPNHPGNYPAGVDQCWVMTPTAGGSVKLSFTSFDVSRSYFFNISVYNYCNRFIRLQILMVIGLL